MSSQSPVVQLRLQSCLQALHEMEHQGTIPTVGHATGYSAMSLRCLGPWSFAEKGAPACSDMGSRSATTRSYWKGECHGVTDVVQDEVQMPPCPSRSSSRIQPSGSRQDALCLGLETLRSRSSAPPRAIWFWSKNIENIAENLATFDKSAFFASHGDP